MVPWVERPTLNIDLDKPPQERFAEIPRDALDASAGHFRHRRTRFAAHVANHDPQTGAVDVVFVSRTNRAGQLHQFQVAWIVIGQVQRRKRRFSRLNSCDVRGRSHEFQQDAARVVNQVTKALRHKNGINVARSRLFDFVDVVIGQRRFERNFDRGVRLVVVWNQSYGHGELVLHEFGYFGYGLPERMAKPR